MKKAKKTPTTVELPKAVTDYYRRIGAEVLNFRRAMVREYHASNYYVERTLIRIMADGTIFCSRKEHEPTKDEAEAIAAAVKSATYPKSVEATQAGFEAWLKSEGKSKENVFTFINQKTNHIIMAQERWIDKTGLKHYLPWTFWSDGVWRCLEPEGALPFWKPSAKGRPVKKSYMIHEGAKAADFVDKLVNDPSPEWKKRREEHPWADELSKFTHWGIIGGALAPHRADYAELKANTPTEVVYFCDNDQPGLRALQEVSKSWGEHLKGIMLDNRWPMSWDCADPMPANFYSNKRYNGPSLEKMLVPATRATEVIPNPEGEGRPVTIIRRAFKEEWLHAVTPEVFIHKDWPNRILTMPEFNNFVRPYSDVDDTARILKRDAASKSAVLKYDPGRRPGIYGSGDSGRFINTHCPSDIKPEKIEAKPFTDFMSSLVPDETDLFETLRWCATLIARPDLKMHYGILLISEVQGIGKGTLGEKILAPLMGAPNVSYPSEEEIVNSQFNYWCAHKRLAVIHEIYAGHSSKAYNKLKSVVTDKFITVSKKYQANYEIENWLHVFACSNSMRAIQLSSDDRRWLVPKLNEDKRKPEYWERLNKWLLEQGGLEAIKNWAAEYVKKNKPVLPGEPAPWTALKKEVVEEGYSPGQRLVAEFLDRVASAAQDQKWIANHCRPETLNGGIEDWNAKNEGAVLILDTDLVKLIRTFLYDGRHSDRLEKPLTMRKIAKSRGWFIGEERVSVQRWGMQGSASRLITSKDDLAKRVPARVAEELKPLDVVKVANEWGMGA